MKSDWSINDSSFFKITGHETEILYFKKEDYVRYKANKEVKWWQEDMWLTD